MTQERLHDLRHSQSIATFIQYNSQRYILWSPVNRQGLKSQVRSLTLKVFISRKILTSIDRIHASIAQIILINKVSQVWRDTKDVIRSCKSKKTRQYNCQKIMDKQSSTKHYTDNSGTPEGSAVLTPLVIPVVLFFLQTRR